MNVLLVEDHERLARFVKQGLEESGFTVDTVTRGEDGLAALGCAHYDALILDLGLPDRDGLDLLREARQRGHTVPVLVVTSRVQVADRVKGLDSGADDYLTKPFAMEELVARVRALLRRPEATLGTVLEAANLRFDPVAREATIDDEPVALSPREMSVLEQLMRRKGRVVPKAVMEDTLYGLDGTAGPNSVEVLIHRLRKRIRETGARIAVHTVRGVGYILVEERDD